MTTASGGIPRRTLPVVRWLQAGSVAAGIGLALVATPGIAAADSRADSSSSDTRAQAGRDANPRDTGQRRGESARRPGAAAQRPGRAESKIPGVLIVDRAEALVGDSEVVTAARSAAVRVAPGHSAERTSTVENGPAVPPETQESLFEAAAAESSRTAERRSAPSAPELAETSAPSVAAAGLEPVVVVTPDLGAAAFALPESPRAVAAPTAAPLGAVNAAVVGGFDSTPARLSSLPGGPVADIMSGALLLVRRTLFADALNAQSASVVAAAGTEQTPTPNAATLAVTNWFSSTRGWLYQFDGPLAEALVKATVGVQNSLFSPVAAVKPVQYTSWTQGEPILGALRYAQPGGAGVSFQLTQAPAAGTVQLLSDGTYSYAPGANFTGTDTFTAQVTSAGFNILDPFSPRTSTVTVNVIPEAPTQLTRGFEITNLTGKGVYVQKIIKEPGYENAIEGAPSVGQILQPGQSTHVELTRYLFGDYDTYIHLAACRDITCTSYVAGDGGTWQVRMHVYLLTSYQSDCTSGNCWNEDGEDIGPGTEYFGSRRFFNSVIKLVDLPGTSYTLTGAEGQQQKNVFNTVCTAQGTTCQFVPTADTQYTTKPENVYQFTNATQDNQTVNQGATATVAATSSFGTTYTSEVSASFGQKDIFNFVAKQTFTSTQSLSNTVQKTSNWAVNTTVRPGYRLITTLDVPVARVTGDYKAQIGNTTYNLTGVSFDFIDPNAPAQLSYTSRTEPVTTPAPA